MIFIFTEHNANQEINVTFLEDGRREYVYKIKQMGDVEAAARLGVPLNSAIFPSRGKGRDKKKERRNPSSLMNNLYCR